jgi:hypothetical protein
MSPDQGGHLKLQREVLGAETGVSGPSFTQGVECHGQAGVETCLTLCTTPCGPRLSLLDTFF